MALKGNQRCDRKDQLDVAEGVPSDQVQNCKFIVEEGGGSPEGFKKVSGSNMTNDSFQKNHSGLCEKTGLKAKDPGER